VVESGGGRPFLDTNAAAVLNDNGLNAPTDAHRQVLFAVTEPFGQLAHPAVVGVETVDAASSLARPGR
jgi:hypothetical protein